MAPNILDPVSKKSENVPKDTNDLRSRILSESVKFSAKNYNQGNNSHLELNQENQQSEENVTKPQENIPFKPQIRWPDLIAQVFIHVGSVYGLYYLFTFQAAFYTYIWCEFSESFL